MPPKSDSGLARTTSYGAELRVSREHLAQAVAPEPLAHVLESLVEAGVLAGFRESAGEVVVWGDLTALEVAIAAADLQAPPPPAATVAHGKAAYFARCREYLHTESFRKLPRANQDIWRLHAIGVSHRDISARLGTTEMRVRTAVQGARTAARLPRTVQNIRRGSGGGRPAKAGPCVEDGCKEKGRQGRGLCHRHYLRRWRAGTLPERTDGR